MRGRAGGGSIRPEQRALIDLCLGTAGAPEILRDADIGAVAELSSRLGVDSYALTALAPVQGRLEGPAARWLERLRRQVAEAAVLNLKRDAELEEALGDLGRAGIEPILLKGSALRLVRPELAGRAQCDVDLLVRRADLARTEGLLAAQGFRYDESGGSREERLRRHFHLIYQRGGAVLELHWDLDPASPAGFVGRLWERSRTIERDGRAYRILAPEHELLFGCLHVSRHAFLAALRWLADLRQQLPVEPETRARFEAEARLWSRRAVYGPLWMLARHGVAGIGSLRTPLAVGQAEALPLETLLEHLLLAEAWLGLPAWRQARVVRAWLFSRRSLLPLLGWAFVEGGRAGLRSLAGSRAAPAAG